MANCITLFEFVVPPASEDAEEDDDDDDVAKKYVEQRHMKLSVKVTNNTDFRRPVTSANVPHAGAQIMVTTGRMAISVPMAEEDRPICCMYNVMNGLMTPVDMRKVKYSNRILFLCDSMSLTDDVRDDEGGAGFAVLGGGG